MLEATMHTKSCQEGEGRECVCALLSSWFLYKPGSQTRESYHPHWPDLLILINSIKMISHKHDQRAICYGILAFAKMTIDNDFHRTRGEKHLRVRMNNGQKDCYTNLNIYAGFMLLLNTSRLDSFPRFTCSGHWQAHFNYLWGEGHWYVFTYNRKIPVRAIL